MGTGAGAGTGMGTADVVADDGQVGSGQVEDAAGPRYATWPLRVVAALADNAILAGAAWLALGSPDHPSTTFVFGGPNRGVPLDDPRSLVPAAALVLLLVLQGLTGWTPAKLLVGIRVVDARTSRPAGVPRTLARTVLHLVDAIFLVGYLRPLWHSQRRTFADSLCDTVVLRRVRPPVPFLGPGTGSGGPTPSRAVTGAATVLSVGSAVFVLGPATVTSGEVWTSSCTPTTTAGSPLTVDDVHLTGWTMPGTVTRWGVTRPSPLPAGAPDEPGLDASFALDVAPGTAVDGPLDAALVLRLETWDGSDLGEYRSPFRVERTADGAISGEVVPPTPDGSGLDAVHVPAAALAALPPAWHWAASVDVEGETVAACRGRGPS